MHRRDIDKQILYRDVRADMRHLGSRKRCGVQWIKSLLLLESSFSAKISSNLRRYANEELAGMYFIYGATWRNGTAAQRGYMKWFPCRNLLDIRNFERLYRMCESGSFYASRFDPGTERYRRTPAEDEAALYTVGNNRKLLNVHWMEAIYLRSPKQKM